MSIKQYTENNDLVYDSVGGSKICFLDLYNLKSQKPSLKIILSVSGRPSDFSNMARRSESQNQFILNVDNYLK